jgi:hypothetical protein
LYVLKNLEQRTEPLVRLVVGGPRKVLKLWDLEAVVRVGHLRSMSARHPHDVVVVEGTALQYLSTQKTSGSDRNTDLFSAPYIFFDAHKRSSAHGEEKRLKEEDKRRGAHSKANFLVFRFSFFEKTLCPDSSNRFYR